jgi:alpha-ribazole phosphatase
MEIYLIRHTTPDVAKGTCYGQTDLDVTDRFEDEAMRIRKQLPVSFEHLYSSPLQRCRKLASFLFPDRDIQHDADLKEIHCGDWEMQLWDALPQAELQQWMNDFVQVPFPGGENYLDLYARSVACFEAMLLRPLPAAVFTHGGVIRSMLSYITQTPLDQSFAAFELPYGCVVRIEKKEAGYEYQIK